MKVDLIKTSLQAYKYFLSDNNNIKTYFIHNDLNAITYDEVKPIIILPLDKLPTFYGLIRVLEIDHIHKDKDSIRVFLNSSLSVKVKKLEDLAASLDQLREVEKETILNVKSEGPLDLFLNITNVELVFMKLSNFNSFELVSCASIDTGFQLKKPFSLKNSV